MIWRNVLIEIEGVKQPVLPATLLSHHPAALHQCTARSDPLHKRRFSTQRSFSTEFGQCRRWRSGRNRSAMRCTAVIERKVGQNDRLLRPAMAGIDRGCVKT